MKSTNAAFDWNGAVMSARLGIESLPMSVAIGDQLLLREDIQVRSSDTGEG
jgi:hypothetical protein